MNMRLLGARTIQEVVPEMVDASNMHTHVAIVPVDRLYDGNCKSTSDFLSFLLINPN